MRIIPMSQFSLASFTKSTLATSLFVLGGCVIHISPSNATIERQQQLSLSASELTQLTIEAEAGQLIIKGDDTATDIRLDAKIFTVKSDDPYTLTLERRQQRAVLVAKNQDSSGMQFYNGQSPSIDLVVTVPSRLLLDITDGSGDLEINNISGNIRIDDGSGNIELSNVGALDIEDGSGNISAYSVSGDVKLIDGSGNITFKQVSGKLVLEDGSGDIDINQVQGTVSIDDDSGNIELNNVAQAVVINDGSGDLTVDQVEGVVTITDGSGNIRVTNTKGLTILESGSGNVSVDNINGPVKLD